MATVPVFVVSRRQEGHQDNEGRRRSVSEPTWRRTTTNAPATGMAGFLEKIGNLFSSTASTPRIYYSGKDYKSLPKKTLVPFSRKIVASYSGPYGGITNNGPVLASSGLEKDNVKTLSAEDTRDGQNSDGCGQEGVTCNQDNGHDQILSRNRSALNWKLRNNRAYGMSVSLYEYKNSSKTDCTGDPIADVFAIRATSNSCIMAVADGVGWGQGSRRAAQCAVKASTEHMWSTLYSSDTQTRPVTTAHVFQRMLESLDKAQDLIISREGSTTTLCLAVIADVLSPSETPNKIVCSINVGDSLAFVYSHRHGVREITFGCRKYNTHRNIRFCNGALGPCFGENPDLDNLTFSMTTIDEGDFVFLATDGISDNFDPVIARRAVANTDFKSSRSRAEIIYNDSQWETGNQDETLPALTPQERQEVMTGTMEQVIRETELPSQGELSAVGLCSKLLQHAMVLTESKRAAHEAAGNIISLCEKECLETQTMMTGREALRRHASGLRGKLDHATVVAYVAGPSAKEEPAANSTQEPPNYFDVSVGNEQIKSFISMIE